MKIIFFIILLCLVGCYQIHNESDCRDETILTEKSPDGKILATLTHRDCGSTTSIAKIIYLKEINIKNEEKKEYGERIFVTTAEADPLIQWKNETLIINSKKIGDDIFMSKDQWRKINILYSQ